ncbi:hypothetical protein F0L16_16115 [Photorhabdus heterorhabditis]|uniref:Uncharacterized protein n=1 Tax=Photorhabdus heterorhabditis TaxID=880156 RepID=A0A5B0W8G7_9GAMM|nr:hypothetical protein F0L16_16115 [Photorhabdus heterorhabditis]
MKILCIISITSTLLSIPLSYTLHPSSYCFVGCVHLPRSQSYLCSRGFVPLPSRSILKSIGYNK